MSNVIILGAPLLSYDLIWNQDPYAHLIYSRNILETGHLESNEPLISTIGLDKFPAFHILLAGFQLLT
ncbi:MAG: hypothetical protein ACXACY_25445, partial [Candidatus Hodarchaeales archaeon]